MSAVHGNRKRVTWRELAEIHNRLLDVKRAINDSLKRGAVGDEERELLDSLRSVIHAHDCVQRLIDAYLREFPPTSKNHPE